MNISKKEAAFIGYMILEIVTVVCFFSFVKVSTVNKALSTIGLIAIFTGISTTYLIYKIYNRINFFVLFIALSFLFAFGQSILVCLGVEMPKSAFSITYSGFQIDELINAAVFCFLGIISTCIGYCLYYKKRVPETKEKPIIETNDRVCKIGWLLLIISIVPTFYLLYKDIVGAFQYGYGYTLQAYTGFDRICSLVSGFFTSSLIILFSFEQSKNKRKCFWIILILYVLFQLLGGSRLSVFRLGITLIVLYICFFKKMDTKKLVILTVTALCVGFIFSIVSNARIYLTGGDIKNVIANATASVWENNFLVSIIREMGNTQIINTLVYAKCPMVVGFQYGFSYLKIIWAVLPNLIGSAYTGYIGVDITFSPLYTLTDSGLGASYLCEGYWNFGWFALLAFLVLGFLFGKLESKFYELCNSRTVDPIKLFLISYIIYYMIFMVRSEMISFGRAFVYYALVPALLCKVKIKH